MTRHIDVHAPRSLQGEEGSRRVDYILELPALPLLNSNQRLHHHERASWTRQIRQTAFIMARNAKLPKLNRVYVVCYVAFGDRRKRDPGNWYPSAKAAVDGSLVDSGVIPDDDHTHLIGPDMRLGDVGKLPCRGCGWLTLHIKEITEGDA